MKLIKCSRNYGYEKTRDGVDCWCNYTKENEFEIAFEKNIKKIFFTNLYNAGDDEEHKAFERIILLDKEELQAINTKVKELGWEE